MFFRLLKNESLAGFFSAAGCVRHPHRCCCITVALFCDKRNNVMLLVSFFNPGNQERTGRVSGEVKLDSSDGSHLGGLWTSLSSLA